MTERRTDPLDEVVSAFRRMPVPDPPADAELFPRLAAARATGGGGSSPTHALRGLLMHPALRYGSAAAVLLITALGWLALGPSSRVTLAAVIRAAEQHELVRYELHRISAEEPGEPRETTSTVYVDLVRSRTRSEARPQPFGEGTALLRVTVHDRRTGEMLHYTDVSRRVVGDDGRVREEVAPLGMSHTRPLNEADDAPFSATATWGEVLPFSEVPEETPFLDVLRALQAREETTSAVAQIDGQKFIMISAREANTTCTAWVDPRTNLPLLIEYEIREAAHSGGITRLICKDFAWDPEVGDLEELFRTEPPARHAGEGDAKTDG